MNTIEPAAATQIRAFRCRQQVDSRGTVEVTFRPLRSGDEAAIRRFFASHTTETILLRYGYLIKELTAPRARELVCVDGFDEFAMAGFVPSDQGERIVAIGRYCREDTSSYAEVAFVVHEEYRRLGIATFLLRKLAAMIAERGFLGISAMVIEGNLPMLHVFNQVLGPAPIVQSSCGQVTLRWPFLPALAASHG